MMCLQTHSIILLLILIIEMYTSFDCMLICLQMDKYNFGEEHCDLRSLADTTFLYIHI